jgi:RNA polymerase sigma factor (sigma-70 family)
MGLETDTELLTRFVSAGDGEAFAALVSRHAPMVHGLALRRTQDRVLAEEVTQTVFAILARKAKSIKDGNLAAWLHNSAFFEARNARRKAARYAEALQRFSEQITDMQSSPDSSPDDIRRHLDEAMSRLPDKARQMLLLRFYEQRSVQEICGETGSNVEACRKRIQRALHQLNLMLRQRGVVSSLTALTSTLAAGSLCVSRASASEIAAVALEAAPGLSKTALLTHSIHVMNTASFVKSSAAIVILAIIPVTVLWNQKADLQKEVDRLRQTVRATAITSAASPRPAMAAAIPAQTTAKEGTAASSSSPASPNNMENTIKRVQDKAKRRANLEFNRLCLHLPDLTEAQKQQVKEALEVNGLAASDKMLEAFRSGAVSRALKKPESLTAEEKASLAGLDFSKAAAISDKETLKAILTAEQYGVYLKAQETRRVGDAENSAFDTLKWIGRTFDLSPDQKDSIFQKLAQHELSPDTPSAGTEGKPVPGLDGRALARYRIIQESLTPPQEAAFDQMRADQMRAIEDDMMQFYAIPTGERTGAQR